MSYKTRKAFKHKIPNPKAQNITRTKYILALDWTKFYNPPVGSKSFKGKFNSITNDKCYSQY